MAIKDAIIRGFIFLLVTSISMPLMAWERLEQLPVPPARDLKKLEEPFFNQSVKLMVEGKHGAAKKHLLPLANTGVVDAQVALASILMQKGNPVDQKDAYRFSYFAAHGGNWNAQITTSHAFRDGLYTERDFDKARHWLKRAAIQGDSSVVQSEVQVLNDTVMGTAVSAMEQAQYDVAEKLLSGLANENVVVAQEKLAGLYKQGFLGQQRKVDAESWYQKAAQAGSQEAQFQLAMEYLTDPKLPQEKRDRAIRLLEQAATPGKAEAQYQLGLIYLKEKASSDDLNKGIFYYRMAAEQGHVDAQYSLGVRYVLGQGVPKNDYEAHRWFKAAADQGVPKAMHNLALTYLYGLGTDADQREAQKWFRSASRDGVKKSAVFLNQGVFNDASPKMVKASLETKQPALRSTPKARKSVAKEKKRNVVRKYETVKGADWFLNLPVKGFTIQVLSARNPESVDSFFDLYGIKKKGYLHYVDNTTKKPLHVIQYGFFKSKKQALRAARKMAKGKKDFKPWVRDIKTIREKIVSL